MFPQLITHLALPHLVRMPLEDSDGAPPLIALLHGIGSNERDLFSFADLLDPTAVVVSARAPLPYGATGFSWYEIDLASGSFEPNIQQLTASRDLIMRFVRDAAREYGADPGSVYLGGFSQGGIMSLIVGLTEPDLVAGICGISGLAIPGLHEWCAPAEALAGMPIIATHGIRDDVIPIALVRESRDELSKLPVDLTYLEYDMRHEINQACLVDLLGWLNVQLSHPWHSPIVLQEP